VRGQKKTGNHAAVISFHRWHYDTRWISEVSCDQSCLEFSWNFRVYGSCRHRAPRRICYSEASETFMGTSRDWTEPLEASCLVHIIPKSSWTR